MHYTIFLVVAVLASYTWSTPLRNRGFRRRSKFLSHRLSTSTAGQRFLFPQGTSGHSVSPSSGSLSSFGGLGTSFGQGQGLQGFNGFHSGGLPASPSTTTLTGFPAGAATWGSGPSESIPAASTDLFAIPDTTFSQGQAPGDLRSVEAPFSTTDEFDTSTLPEAGVVRVPLPQHDLHSALPMNQSPALPLLAPSDGFSGSWPAPGGLDSLHSPSLILKSGNLLGRRLTYGEAYGSRVRHLNKADGGFSPFFGGNVGTPV